MTSSPPARRARRMAAALLLALMAGCGGPGPGEDGGTRPAPEPASPPAPVAAPVPPPAPAPSTSPAAFAWQEGGWGGAGHFYACAYHPTADGVLYLGGDVNGFYRSEDGGRTWRIRNQGLGDYMLIVLAVDAAHPDTVYAGTAGGVCRSDDRGEHWRALPRTGPKDLAIVAEPYKTIRSLAVDPASGAIYAGTPRGRIYRSDDRGESWRLLHELPKPGHVASLVVAPGGGHAVLAATSSMGLLRSDDGGATWAMVKGPAAANQVAFAPSDPQVAYLAGAGEGLWRSADGGATWAATALGGGKDLVLEASVDPRDPAAVACIVREGWSGACLRSTDGGATWTRASGMRRDLAASPTRPDETPRFSTVNNLARDPLHPERLFIAGNWHNLASDDGGRTWEERVRGADITCVTDIRFLDGRTYVTAMDEGLLMSPDRGTTWRALAPRKYSKEWAGHQWRVLPQRGADGRVRIVATSSPWDLRRDGAPVNQVLLSEDGGATFARTVEGLPERRPTANCMWGEGYPRALAADPADPQRLYLGIDGDPEPGKGFAGGGIFTSGDGGRHWERLASQPGARRMFYGLAVDPTDSRRLFWGACGKGGGLWRSEDAGASWQQVLHDEDWVFYLEVAGDGTVYCPGKNLWRSRDHGATWTKLTAFADGRTIVGLALDPADPQRLWISRVTWGHAAEGEVLRSRDGGATWDDITGDIPYRKPLILRYDPAARELWAGNVGLYRLAQ